MSVPSAIAAGHWHRQEPLSQRFRHSPLHRDSHCPRCRTPGTATAMLGCACQDTVCTRTHTAPVPALEQGTHSSSVMKSNVFLLGSDVWLETRLWLPPMKKKMCFEKTLKTQNLESVKWVWSDFIEQENQRGLSLKQLLTLKLCC